MSQEINNKIEELRAIEERMNAYANQKHQLLHKKAELESALNGVKESTEAYKIIGTLMVKKNPEKIKEEVTEELEKVKKRIKIYEEQEENLRKRAEDIEKKIKEEMEKEKK